MNVGLTIYQQLRDMDQKAIWAWGSSSFKSFQAGQLENEYSKNHLGGLVFKVNGYKHKKHVMITLNSKDYYDVQIGSLVKGQFIKKPNSEVFQDIDVESLIETIDDLVEGFFENKGYFVK